MDETLPGMTMIAFGFFVGCVAPNLNSQLFRDGERTGKATVWLASGALA